MVLPSNMMLAIYKIISELKTTHTEPVLIPGYPVQGTGRRKIVRGGNTLEKGTLGSILLY